MDIFLKPKSKFYWYDFTVCGGRFRGSTEESNSIRAQKVATLLVAEAINGGDPLDIKAPTVRDYAKQFLK